MSTGITSYLDELYVCREDRLDREDPDAEISDRFLAANRPDYRLTPKDKKRRQARVSWECMRRRCTDPTHESYKYYGAKGVSVLFESFAEFYSEIGPPPTPGHTVDRIDSAGNYETGNVRWATSREQYRNRSAASSRARQITYLGLTKPIKEWAAELGINYTTLKGRLLRGCPVDVAMSMPVGAPRSRSAGGRYV